MVKLGYRPELDGVRAVAILIVVAGHAFGWVRPSIGVQIFFVLSGFLITTLLLEEHAREGRISLRGFYWRRALRLLPALVVVLLAYAAVFARDSREALAGVAAGLTYSANVWLTWWPESFPFALTPLWSLAMEEQFYLVWPVVLLALLHVGAPRRLVVAGLIGGLAAVTAARVIVDPAPETPGLRHFGPDMQAGGLLVGCLLALWFTSGRARLPRGVGAACFVVVALTVAGPPLTFQLVGLQVAAAGALLAVMAGGGGARVLRASPLVLLGRISYGLYLWHGLFLWATPLPALPAILAAVGVAWLSFNYVEAPFLRLKSREVRFHRSIRPGRAGAGSAPSIRG